MPKYSEVKYIPVTLFVIELIAVIGNLGCTKTSFEFDGPLGYKVSSEEKFYVSLL